MVKTENQLTVWPHEGRAGMPCSTDILKAHIGKKIPMWQFTGQNSISISHKQAQLRMHSNELSCVWINTDKLYTDQEASSQP